MISVGYICTFVLELFDVLTLLFLKFCSGKPQDSASFFGNNWSKAVSNFFSISIHRTIDKIYLLKLIMYINESIQLIKAVWSLKNVLRFLKFCFFFLREVLLVDCYLVRWLPGQYWRIIICFLNSYYMHFDQ